MIKLRWKDKWIDFESIEWSGTDQQCSRQVSFTIPVNPYDKGFEKLSIALGDLIYLYDDKTQLFVGTVTGREKSAGIGTASYVAKDFMHHLLKSKGSYKFKKTTPEKIAKKLCSDLQITAGSLATTKANISKLIFEDQSFYDMIIASYRKVKGTTGKIYLPVMSGKKVCVIEKGLPSGVLITQGVNITDASYSDTTDNMIDRVKITDDKMKNLGKVDDAKNITTYGVYQAMYKKEKGVNAKNQAKAMLVGVTKEASVEAIGDVRAISGYSIEVKDSGTGLSGTFFITSDTHTFSNGVHTMSLTLSWKPVIETGGVSEEDKGKKELTNSAKCYYLESSSVFHSSKNCSACKGKKTKQSTVSKIKKIKITKGKNKGKRKYKACAKCWIT